MSNTRPNILIDGRIGKLVLMSLCKYFGFTANILLGAQYCTIQCSAVQLPYYENTDLENMMIRELHIMMVPELWMIMSSASYFL